MAQQSGRGLPHELFSMLRGYGRARNILGLGDPDVCFFDGRWHMFVGGFHTGFKNNLFCAVLPTGEPLREGAQWRLLTEPDNPRRASPLVAQPSKGEWDHFGLHEPCFVEGVSQGKAGVPRRTRRIYYTGRASSSTTGPDGRFAIGFLEWDGTRWVRHPDPVVCGGGDTPSALGPKVIHHDGLWRMWYRQVPHEPAKGVAPRSQIFFTESPDGVGNWSEPRPFSLEGELLCHAFVAKIGDGFAMIMSRVPNLYGEPGYPAQELLLSFADTPSGERDAWSAPIRVCDTRDGAGWYRDGFFGPSICVAEDGQVAVFFTGVHARVPWPIRALASLRRLKLPPLPAPYYFSIGEVRLQRPVQPDGSALADRAGAIDPPQ